jgi:hypothetical protein
MFADDRAAMSERAGWVLSSTRTRGSLLDNSSYASFLQDQSVGERQLDSGPLADRPDHSNPRDGCGDDGPRDVRDQATAGGEKPGLRQVIPIVIGMVGAVGLLLAVLHGIEAAISAAAYLWLGALASPHDAILYSIDSMTTRGASGLMLQQHWRMMGALEAAGGMLLFGISTAYIFAVMQAYWPMLSALFATHRHPR